MFDCQIKSETARRKKGQETFDNSLLLVKSYLLTHGYQDTLGMIDPNYTKDDLLNSPEAKSKFKMGFFSRRNKHKKNNKKKEEPTQVWSLKERSNLRQLIVEKKMFGKVKEMLQEKGESNGVVQMNLDLRIFLQEFSQLEDENQKIIRLEKEKDFFTKNRENYVIGCKNLKGRLR